MKSISLLLLFLLVTVAAKASLKIFLLTGSVYGKNGQKVELVRDVYGQHPQILASDTVRNNQFRFSCKVDEITPVSVLFQEGRVITSFTVILEEGQVSFQIKEDGTKSVKGGAYNKLMLGYELLPEFIKTDMELKKMTAAGMEKLKGTPAEYQATQLFLKRDEIRTRYLENIMKTSKDPKAKLMAISFLSLQPDQKKAMAMVSSLAPAVGEQSFLVQSLRRMNEEQLATIARRQGIMVGKPYVDFTAATVKGENIQLAPIVQKNKYTLLQFWASWCVPCRREIPLLKSIYSAYHPKGLAIVSFSLDDNRINWEKASEKENFEWYNLSDLKAFEGSIMKNYPVNGIPANVIIDQNGKIVASNLTGDDLEQKIQTLFQ